MKIALVHPAFGSWGGAENVALWLARGLIARGHAVTVFSGAFSDRAQALFCEAGVRIQVLRHMHGRPWDRLQLALPRARVLPLADHVVRLDRRAMRRGARAVAAALRDFDVVNVHNFPAHWWTHEARQAAGGRFPRVVWYCHEPGRTLYPGLFDGPDFTFEPDGSELQAYDREASGMADVILANSAYGRARIAAIYERADVGILYPGIPRESLPATLAAGSGSGLDVLAVTRLVPAKGMACAIEAVARVPGVRLRVAGTGPQRAELEALARDRGVADRVRFLGFVPDAELPALYGSADVALYIPIGEPFGLSLVEAGAYGLPCIASDHGGPSEIVLHGETGYLVDPRSPQAVAQALAQLLHDTAEGAQSRLARMGMAARKRVEDHFTMDRMLEGLESHLVNPDLAGA